MTTPRPECRDLELLLSLRASGPGALEPEEAARLESHLEGCASCRAEAEATAEALALAALPPLSDDERRALRDLPGSVLEELRRRDRRRGIARPLLAGVAVAAAAAAFLLAPALLRKEPSPPAGNEQVAVAEAGWKEPDLDRIWEDTRILDWEANTALAGGYETETATVAALDY